MEATSQDTIQKQIASVQLPILNIQIHPSDAQDTTNQVPSYTNELSGVAMSKKNKPNNSLYVQQSLLNGIKSAKSQTGSTVLAKEESQRKKVLVLYTSGSAGAKLNLQIVRGYLQQKLKQNQYICDQKMLQYLEEPNFLITPEQENGTRLLYKIEQLERISPSINVSLQTIRLIAQRIYQNYNKYYAFIIICGFDVICYISTIISFMFENLSKLVIFTGGYFPISYMRNDTINNLIESFAIISMADNFNDVIIVCKNKGYRANRSIKMKQGVLGSVSTPNLQPLVSVNIKIKFRQHLFLPRPKETFRVWTSVSERVGIIKFHIIMTRQALEYELNNPAYEGYVIESYGSSNLPENLQFLNVFKEAAERQNKIFINVGQPVQKVNSSIMKEYLQQFYIYYGGDMTTEAALSKISYLLSKKLTRAEIKKQIETNLRGELTEIKRENQFQLLNQSFIQVVKSSVSDYYPLNYFDTFISKVQNQVADMIVHSTNSKQFQQFFRQSYAPQQDQVRFNDKMVELINRNNLLHKAVRANNQQLYKYFVNFNVQLNQQDEDECTALYYAVANKDKKAVQCLFKKGCQVQCPKDNLFDLISKQLKSDNLAFFELLYHIEFKETLRQLVDWEGRSVLHKAAILNATNCIKYLIERFKINPKSKDKYDQIYLYYLPTTRRLSVQQIKS